MKYQLIRSPRRTVSLSFDREGELVVRAPNRASQKDVERFIEQKRAWIEKNRQRAQAQKSRKKQFAEGEPFLLLGKEYPLRVTPEFRSRMYFENGFVVSLFQMNKIKKLFEDWYKDKALEIIRPRVGHYSGLMGVEHQRISVKNTRSQWGSCSHAGNLSFSWRLIMAPPEVVDYVVVHELAHILHKNHSAKFWKTVGQFCPDFKARRDWLKKQGPSLQW
jgi:predicted metal-dependent hydrolase